VATGGTITLTATPLPPNLSNAPTCSVDVPVTGGTIVQHRQETHVQQKQ
jgi:hypothetical protein